MYAYNVGKPLTSGGDPWVDSEKFDIVAKPPEGSIPNSVGRQLQLTGQNSRGLSWMASGDNESAQRTQANGPDTARRTFSAQAAQRDERDAGLRIGCGKEWGNAPGIEGRGFSASEFRNGTTNVSEHTNQFSCDYADGTNGT